MNKLQWFNTKQYMKILETDRLILLQQCPDDATFILELLNSPGWLKYIGDRAVKTVEDAANYIRNGAMKSYEQNGFGLYMVKLKDSNLPIGICGLIRRPGLEQVDIGFAFLPKHEGMGYAYESASAVMKYGREALGLGIVVAITTKNNVASVKLLNKIGFSFKEMVTLPGDKEELMLFENKI